MTDDTAIIGTHPERVLAILRGRRANGVRYTSSDGRKIGLVVEGGGMRGVLSAGSLLAVDLLGFRQCFDCVYAVSAGSVNAAYFLSGQGVEGITVYFDDISTRRFINPWRAWKMVDVDFVYDYLVPKVKPLDETAIRAARQEFFVTATDVNTGDGVLLNAKTGAGSIAQTLKASSALPVLYNRSVRIGSGRYMDGGVSSGLPMDWAIAQGCTDLLVLLSRPSTYVSKGPRLFERWMFRLIIGLKYPAMYRSFLKAFTVKERNRRLATGVEQVQGVNVATLCPADETHGVGRTTIDRRVLVQGAYTTAVKVFQVFGEDITQLDRLFARFRQHTSFRR